MVGIGTGTSFESDRAGMIRLWPSEGPFPAWARTSGFTSACFGFQFASKLTIGRPGLSLTAVGVGSLALRSFRRMLVACRISSFLISRPFLVGVSGRGASETCTSGCGFAVYAGFLDCVGGFLWISVVESFLVGSRGGAVRSFDAWSKLDAVKGVSLLDAQWCRYVLGTAGESMLCGLLVWFLPDLFAREGAHDLATDVPFPAGSAHDPGWFVGTPNTSVWLLDRGRHGNIPGRVDRGSNLRILHLVSPNPRVTRGTTRYPAALGTHLITAA